MDIHVFILCIIENLLINSFFIVLLVGKQLYYRPERNRAINLYYSRETPETFRNKKKGSPNVLAKKKKKRKEFVRDAGKRLYLCLSTKIRVGARIIFSLQ